MRNRIILVSDDNNFFDYMVPKLNLRNSDEIHRFSYSEIVENINKIELSLIIINAENNKNKTLVLLEMLKEMPSIIFAYNYDEEFALNAYKFGTIDYITPSTSVGEFNTKLINAFKHLSFQQKNKIYREMLVKNNLIMNSNEVFTDYNGIIDNILSALDKSREQAVFAAIAPNTKSKFLMSSNQIETAILNNIRSNDILMNYGISKYFLLLYGTNIEQANKIWKKITRSLPEKIYAGFVQINSSNRQQLLNDALNKLHDAISCDIVNTTNVSDKAINGTNFKIYKKEFNKKIEKIISPVFYLIQQKYNDKLFGMNIKIGTGDGYGVLYINDKYSKGIFKITCPGLSKINIDISYNLNDEYVTKTNKLPESKRISLEPDELDASLLEDLIEQFLAEFKNEVNNEYTK